MNKQSRPVRSMTGFGEAAFTDGSSSYRLYLYSVNHRFLELSARLPDEAFFLEAVFKKTARAALRRGRVSLTVEKSAGIPENEIHIDAEAAGKYIQGIREISSAFGLNAEINPSLLLSLPGVVRAGAKRPSGEKLRKEAVKALKNALKNLVAMKEEEGAGINQAMNRSIEAISRHSASLRKRTEVSKKKRRKLLETRIREAGIDSNEAGFASEIANLANKLDVTEEIERLDSHIRQFNSVMAKAPSGIKIDFILQELLRETNTIASKSQDIIISRKTIEMKTEIQKLKEQAQNIE